MSGDRSDSGPLVLVTGATGYIGGRLVPRLIAAGHRVRCLVRDPARVDPDLADKCEVMKGSVDEPDDLQAALKGVSQAYYLIHAMRDNDPDFASRDRALADGFGAMCARTGVDRIIYLGGLGNPDSDLSHHLRSRHEVGEVLAAHGVPVLEFRAAVIIGSGSASFEMLRHLVERIPVMITPSWVRTRCQPIAVRTVLNYLLAAMDHLDIDGVHEIGGKDVLTYAEMLKGYAAVRGLRRLLIPVPILSPSLSSWWVHLVTPIPRSIARPLVDGLRCEVIVRQPGAAELFGVNPMPYRDALRLALERLAAGDLESAWHSSFSSLADRTPADRAFVNHEGMLVEKHQRRVNVDPATAFAACCQIGGAHGWPGGSTLWRIRAAMDRMIGGVGFRRGRRDLHRLRVGDAVDFWRVQHVTQDEHGSGILILHAEMKLPGEGWLHLAADPWESGSTITVTAFYEPRGLFGLAYWLATLPLHRWVFPAMTAGIARRATAIKGKASTAALTPN